MDNSVDWYRKNYTHTLLLDPEFDDAGRVHDWRNYVGENVKTIWKSFTHEQRCNIAADADYLASREDWD